MSIAILATGDEIIQGDTLNTNTHAIAHVLQTESLSLGLHLSCGDNEQEIADCIAFLSRKHRIIIITGGLGPTSDDRTRFALARYLGLPLQENPIALQHVQERLIRANLPMNAGNRQQAMFPEQAVLLANPYGTALGCYLLHSGSIYILLPGPPRECLPMFNQYILPLLGATEHSDKVLLKWRLFGVAESQIAEILEQELCGIDCEVGYRLDTPYVEFKVRCMLEQVDIIKQLVEPLIAPHIIATTDLKASEKLQQYTNKLREPISIIDEVTGGKLQTLIQCPENFDKVFFYPKNAVNLQFHLTGLQEFWSQLPGVTESSLTIKYSNSGGQGSETRQIPYRGPLVIDFAAEWLSFRLLHLIDQLHK
ncbi:MAG: competence/damage-inducible protein A [Legionella sp.]